VRIEDLEAREKPIKVGMISLHEHQYLRKAVDIHWPCTITMKGSTLISNEWFHQCRNCGHSEFGGHKLSKFGCTFPGTTISKGTRFCFKCEEVF